MFSPKNTRDLKFTAGSMTSPTRRIKTLRKAEKKVLTPAETRDKHLSEIFSFYSRQHIQHGMAFEDFEEEMRKIDLGEFSCIVRDF